MAASRWKSSFKASDDSKVRHGAWTWPLGLEKHRKAARNGQVLELYELFGSRF